jgi:natural product precursor
MKKISLRGISEILSEKELKNVMGGSNPSYKYNYCYECGGYPDRQGVIWSNNSMDYIYDTFADVCTYGGFLYEC